MKKFLKRLLTFLVGLLAIFVLNGAINYLLYTNIFCGIEDSNTLIIGDSHLRRGLNPELFENAVNISQGAEPFPLTYWKLRKVLQEHTPDTLLIGFGPHNLSSFHDYKFSQDYYATEMLNRSYPLIDPLDLQKVKVDYLTYLNVLWKRTGLYPTLDHCDYIGTFENTTTTDLSNIDERIQHHFYQNGKTYTVSNTVIYYLNAVLKLSQKHDVEPVLISAPVHSDYYKGIPSNIMDKYKSLVNKFRSEGIKVINKTDDFYPDSFYRDGDHLNLRGAQRFTKEIKKALART